MIARVWRGYTPPESADAYESMLKPELLPGLSTKPGFRGSYLLRRASGEEVEFITIMLRDSLDAVRALTGPDCETAVVPEDRRKHLSRYDAETRNTKWCRGRVPGKDDRARHGWRERMTIRVRANKKRM